MLIIRFDAVNFCKITTFTIEIQTILFILT